MAGKRIVILGGGTGGIEAAIRLRKLLGKEHSVALIDRSPYYTYEPSLPWVMTGRRTLQRISRDLRGLRKQGIEVHTGEIDAIDLESRRATCGKRELDYDYLVIALGAEYSAEDAPGLNRAWTFYHGDGADGMREELETFASGRIVCAIPCLPVKCPAAFYEGVLLLDEYFRKLGLRHGIEISAYAPEPAPLSDSGRQPSECMATLLAAREISFAGGVEMKSVNHEKKLVNFREGEPVPFDMLVATPVHKPPFVLREIGLAGEDGWLAADRETLATAAPGVYAIGDCVSIPTAGGTLPKTGVIAAREARVVAQNIAAEIAGRAPSAAFSGQGSQFVDVGGGRGMYLSGDYYADPLAVELRGPSRMYYWAKIGAERMRLRRRA